MVSTNSTVVRKTLALALIAGAVILGLLKSSIFIPFTAIHFRNSTDVGVWPPNYTPYTILKNGTVTPVYIRTMNTAQINTTLFANNTKMHSYPTNVRLVIKGFKIIGGAVYIELEVQSKIVSTYKLIVYGPRNSIVNTKDAYTNSTAYLQLARPCRSLEPGVYTIHLYLNDVHILSKKLLVKQPKVEVLNHSVEVRKDTKVLKLVLVSDIPTFIRKAVVIEDSSVHEHVYLCKPVYGKPTTLELEIHSNKADIVLLNDKGVELARFRFVNNSILG